MTDATQVQPDVFADRAKALVAKLWNDKDIGSKLRQAAKEAYPDVTLPEDALAPTIEPLREALESTREELKTLREERAAEKKAADEKATELNLEQALANARSKFNLTDEGFDKMVERMKATGNYSDAEAAAAWVAQQTPPPPPPGPTWAPQALNLFGSNKRDEELASLHKDPEGFMDDQFKDFVQDPDGFTRKWAPEYFSR